MEYQFETKQAGHPGFWAEFGGNIQFPVHVKIKCKKGQNISGIISLAHTFLLKKSRETSSSGICNLLQWV